MSNALLEPQDWDCVVAEVSSYQLEWPAALRPRIGVVLNLTPDHLARHGDMDGYAAAKCRLFARMEPSDFAVIPANDPIVGAHAGFRGTRLWLGDLPGVLRHGDEAHIVVPSLGIDTMLDLSSLAVPGDHNKANAATAALVALVMGATPELVQDAMGRLQPLAHRMEVVADVGGVRWINDSKATNVDAARVGLAGLGQPAVVLLGGQAKGPGFAALASVLEPHPAVLCFGASGQAIADELTAAGVACETHPSMQAAVQQAARIATGGQAVLLSPGCASFDEFNDFEHRGRVFADLARALTSETRDG